MISLQSQGMYLISVPSERATEQQIKSLEKQIRFNNEPCCGIFIFLFLNRCFSVFYTKFFTRYFRRFNSIHNRDLLFYRNYQMI